MHIKRQGKQSSHLPPLRANPLSSPPNPLDTILSILTCTVLAAISLVLIVSTSPLGEWVFTGRADKVSLAVFLFAAAVLGSVTAGTALWLAMISLEHLYRVLNPFMIIVAAGGVTITWLVIMLMRPSGLYPFEMPLYIAGILLVALAARRHRPWRQWDAIVLTLCAFWYFTAPWLAELLAVGDIVDTLVNVAPCDDSIQKYVTTTIRLSIYGIVVLGILAGRRLPQRPSTTVNIRPMAWA